MFSRNEFGDNLAQPNRAFHPWTELEEYQPHGGMWVIPPAARRPELIEASQALMADPDLFAEAMRRAVREWPKSCAVALTTPGLNRRAWIGHAGCYLATESPEETTRLGWHELDDGEQYAANAAADRVIAEWVAANQPDQPALFGFDYA